MPCRVVRLSSRGGRCGKRRGQVGEAREIVHRAEVVDVLDDRARADGKERTALPAQERTQPDQALATLVQALQHIRLLLASNAAPAAIPPQ
jgi:hypothetical protein